MEPQEFDRLWNKRQILLRRIAEAREFIRGSVVEMKRPCTYPGCRKCASGEKHPTWVLTFSRKGKTHTVYLGAGRVAEAQRQVASYRRLMGWIEEVAEINRGWLTRRSPPDRKGVRHERESPGP
jgi:hypothetical protein